MVYAHVNSRGRTYYLHGKTVRLQNGREQAIYWFAPEVKKDALDELPLDGTVVENARTGLPMLRRVKKEVQDTPVHVAERA